MSEFHSNNNSQYRHSNNKKRYFKRPSDKDFLRPLSMPNKKVILSKFEKEINDKGIALDRTDVFDYHYMDADYKVYVSTNMANSFAVNISTIKGRILHCDIVDIRGTTKTAADYVFGKMFKGHHAD